MAIIAKDPRPAYTKISDIIGFGKHEGCTFEMLLDEVPDYVIWLVENNYLDVEGELADEIDKISHLLDQEKYGITDDPWNDGIWDRDE